MANAKTAKWDIGIDFLRPSQDAAAKYGWDPVKAGRGGGVILIEIADEDTSGSVTYSYTDFDILAAIEYGMLRERRWTGRGRPGPAAKDNAAAILKSLRNDSMKVVRLPKNVFITVDKADDLLGVMGMRSDLSYGVFAIRNAYGFIQVDAAGTLFAQDHSIAFAAAAHHNLELLCGVQPTSKAKKVAMFDPFKWKRPPSAGPSVF